MAYPQSKLASERALQAVDGLDVRVLRLAFVYGDGDTHLQDWLPQLRTWPGNRRFQLVHHLDVARGVEALLTTAAPSHRVYNIADEETLPARAILDALRDTGATTPDVDEKDAVQGVMSTDRIREDLGFRALYPSLRSAISDGRL
jgi:nucleoside-diphosphate-sugar epimerase